MSGIIPFCKSQATKYLEVFLILYKCEYIFVFVG